MKRMLMVAFLAGAWAAFGAGSCFVSDVKAAQSGMTILFRGPQGN